MCRCKPHIWRKRSEMASSRSLMGVLKSSLPPTFTFRSMPPPDATPVRPIDQADDGCARQNNSPVTFVTRTLRLKVKSESYPWLNIAAMEVNTVWNWSAQVSEKAASPCTGPRRWLSGFYLCNLSAGASAYFQKIGADTIQRVNGEYALKRSAARRLRLRWRTSRGPRRSLGWIPFRAASLKRKGCALRF